MVDENEFSVSDSTKMKRVCSIEHIRLCIYYDYFMTMAIGSILFIVYTIDLQFNEIPHWPMIFFFYYEHIRTEIVELSFMGKSFIDLLMDIIPSN